MSPSAALLTAVTIVSSSHGHHSTLSCGSPPHHTPPPPPLRQDWVLNLKSTLFTNAELSERLSELLCATWSDKAALLSLCGTFASKLLKMVLTLYSPLPTPRYLPTYLLLPPTYYYLPTTYYLLPATNLLPTTYYYPPPTTTHYSLPTSYYPLPTIHYLPTTYSRSGNVGLCSEPSHIPPRAALGLP